MTDIFDGDDPVLDRESNMVSRGFQVAQRRAKAKSTLPPDRQTVEIVGRRVAAGEIVAEVARDLGLSWNIVNKYADQYVRAHPEVTLKKKTGVKVLRVTEAPAATKQAKVARSEPPPAPQNTEAVSTNYVRIRIELAGADGETIRRTSRVVAVGELSKRSDLHAVASELIRRFWPLKTE